MSVLLSRHLPLQKLRVQVVGALDGQGKPSYGEAVEIEGRVLREDKVVRLPGGEDVRSVVSVWINGCAEQLPNFDDRVTVVADSLVGIVVERKDVKGLQSGGVDHVRIRLREE